MKAAGFGNDGNCAAAAGGRLLIHLFNQAAFNQLAGNFCDAGGRKLALFRNLDTGYRPLLVNQAVDRCTV